MQDAGEVGQCTPRVPVPSTWGTALLQCSALLLCVVYLVSTSMGNLAPMASKVIRWASGRHKPALRVAIMERLTWARDVQRKIPVPSLPYGFKLFLPGNFPYGNSQEIPEIWEFPELREFPVLRESREFPSYGKLPFSKCTYIRFSIDFLC